MVSTGQSQQIAGGSAAPPTPQEISRKLSVHNKPVKPVNASQPVSGTESDSDSYFSPDQSPLITAHSSGGSNPHPIAHPHGHAQNHNYSLSFGLSTSASSKPLSSIAERRSASGDEETDEDEDGDEEWYHEQHPEDNAGKHQDEESVIKTGYLWKKGERRKTWKKRWFVLRPSQLAFYKSSAEYQLLRLLDLSDVHSCSAVELKRHPHSFVLVSPTRTYYLQAQSEQDMHDWIQRLNETRETLLGTSTRNSASIPITIPASASSSRQPATVQHSPIANVLTPSPPSTRSIAFQGPVTSESDTDDQAIGDSSGPSGPVNSSPSKVAALYNSKDPQKALLSGYLMKCRSKRRGWRKRWFVLTSERLMYSASHMDTKRRRSIEINTVIDALEYDLSREKGSISSSISPTFTAAEDLVENDNMTSGPGGAQFTFKIVTMKRALLLCAPSEEEEIKWLSTVRALIARRASSQNTTSTSGADASSAPAIKSSTSTGGRKRSASGTSALALGRDEHH